MVTDDDTWLSPPRLMHDLRELLDHPRHVLYGPLAFAAGSLASVLGHGHEMGWDDRPDFPVAIDMMDEPAALAAALASHPVLMHVAAPQQHAESLLQVAVRPRRLDTAHS